MKKKNKKEVTKEKELLEHALFHVLQRLTHEYETLRITKEQLYEIINKFEEYKKWEQ